MAKKVFPQCLIVFVILVLGFGLGESNAARSAGTPTWELSFKGTATGGSLVLARTRNRTVRYVSIQTSPGESAETIVRRLAETINGYILKGRSRGTKVIQYDTHILWGGGSKASVSGAAIVLPFSSSDYVLAGTESGLGIPAPPLSLSCAYNEDKDEIVLRWINPPDAYDSILIKCFWSDFDHEINRRIAGTSTSFTIDRKKLPVNVDDMDFRVIGIRDNIPSNAAAIHGDRYSQTEFFGIPFTGGLAPNWSAWTTASRKETTRFEQGDRFPMLQGYNPALGLLSKPFYQVIKAPANGSIHGVYRKFLGLTPGHTYRLTACLSTLEMNSTSAENDWSLSLCAAHNGSGGQDLAVQQLAGAAPLANGTSGPEAGRIASYNRGATTKDFEIVLTDDEGTVGSNNANITLPSGVATITIWVRFRCSDPDTQVGFAGVGLEDVSANKNPRSAEHIIQRERGIETAILRYMEQRRSAPD